MDLNGFAGETVQFRFRMLSDAAVGAPGWLIDDFTVTYCEEPIIPEITMQKTVGTESDVSFSSISDVSTNFVWPLAAFLLLAASLGLLFWRRREDTV